LRTIFENDYRPRTKDEGLKRFQENGYLLVDPIYEPVDKLPDKEADRLILENYLDFIRDLNKIISNKKTKIILIKNTICALLEQKLTAEGFNVLNQGVKIPFP
jgi:hypothetical protein